MAMDEYIKLNEALKYCRPDDWGTPDERWRPESEYGKILQSIPRADVVEVVRCKDCKEYSPYLTQFEFEPRGDGYCKLLSQFDTVNVYDDFFCARGERKADG